MCEGGCDLEGYGESESSNGVEWFGTATTKMLREVVWEVNAPFNLLRKVTVYGWISQFPRSQEEGLRCMLFDCLAHVERGTVCSKM